MSEKSILEQALLQVQTLEEAVKQNAKGILASTMKQELNDLLKESLEEEEEDETSEPKEEETEDMPDESENEDEEEDDEFSDDEETGSDEEDLDKDIDSMDSDNEMGHMNDFDSENSDDDVMDMTGASHDEVLKVFKAMKPEDGIVVKKDGDEIEFNDGEDEYIIKLDDEDDSSMVSEMDFSDEDDSDMEQPMEEYMYEDDMEQPMTEYMDDEMNSGTGEETVYEIELDEESDDEENEPQEGEYSESARTIGNGYHAGLKSKKKYFAGNKREDLNESYEKLKKQNAEYKKALILFKEKLNEVAVFNANLAYATRLFTENSTTKQEKLNILKRFDSVSTMNESKNLFKSISNELVSKKPVTESIAEKISTTPTSSSTEVLSESKAYENPQFKRMKDLMSKIK
jgi:hypothetical protein